MGGAPIATVPCAMSSGQRMNCCALATRLRCVSITPLGKPVVPLEQGSRATSMSGSIAVAAAVASCASSSAQGVAPLASPRTTIASSANSRSVRIAIRVATPGENRVPGDLFFFGFACFRIW